MDALQHLWSVLRSSIARDASKMTASLHLRQEYKLLLVFVALLLAILGNSLLALRSFDNLVARERVVSRTHAVEAQVAEVETTLVKAESGERGYLLTGDSGYLAMYDAAHSRVGAQVTRLRALLAGDAAQQARVAALDPLITQLFAELQQAINLRAQQQAGAAAAPAGDAGKQTMDTIRALFADIDVAEDRLLVARMDRAANSLAAGQITMLLATFTDVVLLVVVFVLVWRMVTTRERHLRTESAARAEAEAAVALRDEFVSIASHELRTPLAVLLGNIQLLERRLSRTTEPDEHLQQSFAAIHRQLARLQALVSAMLDVSRIERGQLTIALDTLDLVALVRAAVDEVGLTEQEHPIDLVLPQDPPEAILIRGDALRLDQVLLNLLQNAITYSPEGGSITVEVTRGADDVSIAVTDHGQGISEDALPHLFERFYRVPEVRTEHIGGMGIGLYVVREIVALHGGTVTVTSKEGSGSTFTVRLPLVTPAEPVNGEGSRNIFLTVMKEARRL